MQYAGKGELCVIRPQDSIKLINQYASKPPSRSVPYKAHQEILLIGEGDFSFALSLSALLGTHPCLLWQLYEYISLLYRWI